jgi:chromosome partitioning protein
MAGNGWITPAEMAKIFGGLTPQAIYKKMRVQDIPTCSAKNKRRSIEPMGVKKLFGRAGLIYPKINISFQIVKGGTGKTSLAYALAIRASHYGAKILVIDFDQQANLTRSFDVDAREVKVWLHVVRDRLNVEKSIIKVNDHIDLLPSNLNNSRLDVELSGSASNLRDMVRDKISKIRNSYDLVIMDCPPAINKVNTAAACASDLIVVPINPDPYAIDGLDLAVSEFERIKEEFKTEFQYKLIWNRYDARERLGVVYMHRLGQELAEHVLPVVIRTDTSLKNAVFEQKSIYDLPKKSAVHDDIDQFAREILGINEWAENRPKKAA